MTVRAEDTSRDAARVACPFCRFENLPGVDVCADCSARLDVASDVPIIEEVPALPGQLAPPPPRVRKDPPPPPPPREEVAPEPGLVLPKAPSAPVGQAYQVGVPGVVTGPLLDRIAREDQFVPESLRKEREAERARQEEERERDLAIGRGSREEALSAAITGALAWTVTTALFLPYVSPFGLALAPVNGLIGAAAGALIARSPSSSLGAVLFGLASIVMIGLSASPLPFVAVLWIILATATGGLVGHVLHDRRLVAARGRREGEGPSPAERRHRLFEIEAARLRATCAGAALLGLAWLPCALARGGGVGDAIVSLAVVIGCLAVRWLIRRLSGLERGERGKALRGLATKAFAVAAAPLLLHSLVQAPVTSLLGVLLAVGAARGFEGGVARLYPDVLSTPEEEGVAER